jgi:hypothetical protein
MNPTPSPTRLQMRETLRRWLVTWGALGLVSLSCVSCPPGKVRQQSSWVPSVPHPNPVTDEELLEDIAAQTHDSGGYSRLAHLDGSLVVGWREDVESEVEIPDYVLLRIDDRASAAPLFYANVDKDGTLGGLAHALKPTFQPGVSIRPELPEVVARLETMYGKPVTARYVLIEGNLDPLGNGDPIQPSVRADTPAGRFYVNGGGEVWRETSQEPRPAPGVGETVGERVRRERLIIRRKSVSRITKMAGLF